jgi:DNA-binding NtrC family response regulator
LTDLKFAIALSHFIFLGLRNAREIERAQSDAALNRERSAQLQRELLAEHKIVGGSPALLAAYDNLKRAAEKDVPILLQGESGTGKELFARAAHNLSPRRREPFIAISIAEINPNLVESELFGHEKGAFTGAFQRKIGKFELAQSGTLFLDELAEIPLHLQAKLLRVMETRTFERVGGHDPIEATFRLVCATHQSLEQMVQRGAFRADLFYRLVGVQIRLPPLREHIEDIPEIARHILNRIRSPKTFSPEAVRQLQRYSWPGNVRQLVRVVEAVDALCPRDEIQSADLPPPLNPAGGDPGSAAADVFPTLADEVARVEREHIRRALALTQGNKEKAREMLGISKDTFWKRLKEFNLL